MSRLAMLVLLLCISLPALPAHADLVVGFGSSSPISPSLNDPRGYYEMDAVGNEIAGDTVAATAGGHLTGSSLDLYFGGGGIDNLVTDYRADAIVNIYPQVVTYGVLMTIRMEEDYGTVDFALNVYDQEGYSVNTTFSLTSTNEMTIGAMTDGAELGELRVWVDPGIEGGVRVRLVDVSLATAVREGYGFQLADYSDSESPKPSNLAPWGGSQGPAPFGGSPVPELPVGAQGLLLAGSGMISYLFRKLKSS